jgi:RNA polymerase sigma-70 factor, ECF subfamily
MTEPDWLVAGSDVARQREIVDAFFAAAHRGDFDALVSVLDPDVVARIDGGTARPDASGVLRGAAAVAGQTLTIALPSAPKRPILVNGAAGVVITLAGRPVALMSFAVSGGKITEIDAITDPARLARLGLAAFYGGD